MNIKNNIRKLNERLKGDKISRLPAQWIESADIISFDIYDTLVLRNCSYPEIVFDIVEKEYNTENNHTIIHDFTGNRKESEKYLRTKYCGREITIDEIYSEISKKYGSIMASKLKELEQKIEYEICYPNKEVKVFYDSLRDSGKKIIIISDMYLPKYLIANILSKCGYVGYENLYVSSDYGVTKRSGELYDVINSKRDNWIHIGDNYISDYLSPKRKGITAFLYHNKAVKPIFLKDRLCHRLKSLEDRIALDVLKSFVSNEYGQINDLSKSVGVEVLGPVLFGYCQWLHSIVEKERPDCIWFLAREGKILQEAWHILYPENKIRTIYIYVSRLATCRASVINCKNYDDLISLLRPVLRGVKTVGDLIHVLGLKEFSTNCVQNCEMDLNEKIDNISDKDKLYQAIMIAGKDYFEEQNVLFTRYLNSNNENVNKVIISDIGWGGSMQLLISGLLPKTVFIGTYFGVRNDFKDADGYIRLDRRGYWFEPSEYNKKGVELRFATSAMESLLLNEEGSTLEYSMVDNKILAILDRPEYIENDKHINMKYFALDCLEEIKEKLPTSLIDNLPPEVAFYSFVNLADYPSKHSIEYFRDYIFADSNNRYSIIPKHKLSYYCTHLLEFFKEFELNTSKALWLKGLFRIPFPYFKTLKLLTRIGFRTEYNKKYLSN